MIIIPRKYKEETISRYGQEGIIWLNSIHTIIKKYKLKFKLHNIKLIKNLSVNIVCYAYSEIYGDVVVKVGTPGKTTIGEINFIANSNSKYMSKCFYYNYEDKVIILEKITPGTSLKEVEKRSDRIDIFCNIVNDLIMPLNNNERIYREYHIQENINNLEKYNDLNLNIQEKISIAKKLYNSIENCNLKKYVLHRDLHHKNILKSNESWKVIDPHGVIGYRVFELTQFIKAELENENINSLYEIISSLSKKLNEEEQLIYKAMYIDTVNKILHYITSNKDKEIIIYNNKLCEKIVEKIMTKGIIIAGFATCGKSVLGKKYSNVIDLESSNYKYNNTNLEDVPVEARKGTKRKVNNEWPDNYYKAIRKAIKIYDVVLVQLKPEHFDYFDKNNIKYSIAYPNINNWEAVKKKCINRGNNENFIRGLKNVFVPFYEDCLKRNYENLYIINEDETLESVLIKNNIELKGSVENE